MKRTRRPRPLQGLATALRKGVAFSAGERAINLYGVTHVAVVVGATGRASGHSLDIVGGAVKLIAVNAITSCLRLFQCPVSDRAINLLEVANTGVLLAESAGFNEVGNRDGR